MVHASAQALANSLTPEERERNLLYPDVERVRLLAFSLTLPLPTNLIDGFRSPCPAQIREVSIVIAHGVIRSAQKLGVDRNEALRSMTDIQLEDYVSLLSSALSRLDRCADEVLTFLCRFQIRGQLYHPLLAM
jgi:malate dehydrogenase (oxaloacetate-decarboxylating)(NADP+)